MLQQNQTKEISAFIKGGSTVTATMEKIQVAVQRDPSLSVETKKRWIAALKRIPSKILKQYLWSQLIGSPLQTQGDPELEPPKDLLSYILEHLKDWFGDFTDFIG